ncbi:MAG: agmatine deiminase family protein [Alphaproteobacteria bacterium]|nr:agmatine deiminase family protein [Alphaproteobacteria bacterium]MBU0795708.1 agmatine deiminase family protein [Alphaproteobacteria bacterium]MBU0887331.1 agmatine deiminase family protein [Alphaproteobacteria bacterium]MBU1811788.1 agmatine deiminase family protein [Alphaproteobacteria bacterium]MBU2091079.1 agmatine deiminase family protein [Alphaproteobacteria bacterium]
MSTPARDGFHMPGEWHPHRRCWMAWPVGDRLWGENTAQAHAAFVAVVRAISRFEPVTMLVNPADAANARALLGEAATVIEVDFDDSWFRDSGPSFVIDGTGSVAGVDWVFNAWGNRQPHERDAALAGWLLQREGLARYASPLVNEGGAIHVDGEGTMLAVETTVPNPNRNPGLGRADIERELCAATGCTKVIWLPGGLDGDYGPVGTDGHIDTVACFARPGVVLAQVTRDPADSDYETLQANLAILKASTDAQGRRLEIVEIEQPARREDHATGGRLPMSYVNFYLAGTPGGPQGLVLPVYDDPADAPAIATLQRAFPEREIVTIPGTILFEGGGGVHCITQQEPAA